MSERRKSESKRSILAPVVTVAAIGVAVTAFGQQAPGDRPAGPPAGGADQRPPGGERGRRGPGPADQQAVELTGTVQSFNYGPRGEVEGFILKTGDKIIQVNAPRDAGAELTKSLKIGGDAHVQAVPDDAPPPPGGERRGPGAGGPGGGGPDGDGPGDGPGPKDRPRREDGPGPRGPVSDHPVYRLQSIAGPDGRRVNLDGPESRKFVHVEGTVKQLNYGRRGEVNGVQLDNGDLVRLPPEAARQLNLSAGQKLTVDGFAQPMPAGDHQAIRAVAVNGQGVGPEGEGPQGRGPGGPPHHRKGPPPGGPDGAGPGPDDGPGGQGPGPGGQGPRGRGPGGQGPGARGPGRGPGNPGDGAGDAQ